MVQVLVAKWERLAVFHAVEARFLGKMVKFNPGLNQILSKVSLLWNM